MSAGCFIGKLGDTQKINFINIEIGVLKSILFENLYIYISFLKLFIEFDTFRTILISFKMNKGILHIFGQKKQNFSVTHGSQTTRLKI